MGGPREVPDFTPFFQWVKDAAPDCFYVFVPAGVHTALGSGLAGVGGGLAIEIVGISPVFAIQYLVFFLIVVATARDRPTALPSSDGGRCRRGRPRDGPRRSERNTRPPYPEQGKVTARTRAAAAGT